jgi:hypothetical protein
MVFTLPCENTIEPRPFASCDVIYMYIYIALGGQHGGDIDSPPTIQGFEQHASTVQ